MHGWPCDQHMAYIQSAVAAHAALVALHAQHMNKGSQTAYQGGSATWAATLSKGVRI